MNTLDYIFNKYRLAFSDYIEIPNVGRNDLASLLHELNFKVGVEVGVDRGIYSEILSKANPQMKLYGVDPWDSPEISNYEEALKSLSGYPNYHIIKEYSVDAVKKFDDESLDFVYIDANHQYSPVIEDIKRWSKKVRRGGIVAGHDYYETIKKQTHVKKAVNDYVKENRVKPLIVWGLKNSPPGVYRDKRRSWMWVKDVEQHYVEQSNVEFPISTIIFSKNRACQLELLLRNLNMPAVVIYTFDPEFRLGYEKLIDMYPSFKFIKETNLKEQVLENLGEYTMFDVDDDVMIDHFNKDCPEFLEFKRNPDILCLSLRLCPSYRGAPDFTNNTWLWRGLKHSWGYPMALTATIFRKGDIAKTIENSTFKIPNDLEVVLRRNPPDRPLMLCFDKVKTITNEANRVQNKYPSPNFGVDLKELEQRFLNGERLSLEYIKEMASNARDCFIRVDYKWETAN